MKKIHFFLLLIVATLLSISVEQLNFNDRYSKPINGDGKGYYAYLPAIFIYGDFTYKFVDDAETKYYPEDKSHAKEFLAEQPNGSVVNKYFPGVALFYLPFFGLASLLSLVFGLPVDGYSILFQWSVPVAHWFYLFCALLVLYEALIKLEFKRWAILSGLVLVCFATNLMYYVVYDFTVTHLFGFFGCSLLIWCLVNYKQSLSFRYIGIFISVLAILLIVRPTNLLMLFVVPLILDWKSIFELVKPKVWFVENRWIYLSLASFILFLAPLLWKIQSGNWIVYSYGKEGFNFFKPHLFEYLFSYEKGWFLWSPLVLLMFVCGGIYFYRYQKTKGLIFFTSFAAIAYIFSCWWIWTFGLAFGQRPMIDYYPILVVGFVGFLTSLKRKGYLLFALPFVIVNYIQTFQFHEGILNDKTIDGKTYWRHFLQVRKDPPRIEISKEWRKTIRKSMLDSAFLSADHPFSREIILENVPEHTKLVVTCYLSGANKKTDTHLILSDQTGSFYKVHYLKGDIYSSIREMQFSFDIDQKVDAQLKCYLMNHDEYSPVYVKRFDVDVYQKM